MTLDRCDLLLRHARLATMVEGSPYGLVEDGALAASSGTIVWVGADAELPKGLRAEREVDCGGALLTPGLIDCHTHLVWGGDRLREHELRAAGTSYAEIARQGGGINATVRSTRAAGEEELYTGARRRLDGLAAEGVTTVEIKSGYGLTTEVEMRMLRVARRLGNERGMRVHTSFLGLHALPEEDAGRRDAYVDRVVEEMLPAVDEAGLADAVDAFCETIAFTPSEVERLFAAARARGLPVKLHAEQLSDQGGAVLAARYGALSADHLEYLEEGGVRALAAAGTVAVLLPGAFLYLQETRRPPVASLRRHRVPMALATDLNPGSSPVHSLLAVLSLGGVLFGLSPCEALAGVTRHAARALGVLDRLGTLEVGKRADMALFEVAEPAELSAYLGLRPCTGRWIGGLAPAIREAP